MGKDTAVSDEELEELAHIYKRLSSGKRSILNMGGSLLLASQEAENKQQDGCRATIHGAAHASP